MSAAAVSGGVVSTLVGLPLFVVLLGVTATSPAAQETLRVTECAGPQPATGTWRPPFQQAYTLTTGFGDPEGPGKTETDTHDGVGLVSDPAPGPVVAASAGTVTFAGNRDGLGTSVDVTHDGAVITRYGHLAELAFGIEEGITVSAGQQLGTEGATGTSTGNHLHFEVLINNEPTDPVAFMLERGAPLNGESVAASTPPASPLLTAPAAGEEDVLEGGIGFPLPEPGTPRQDSLVNPPLPLTPEATRLYQEAAAKYAIPWTLLAGIGMEETAHGANTGTSTAGARGWMQFMPATWVDMGVDGDGDGTADIDNDADSIYSAANYLTQSGVNRGPEGVREALWAYNHADWYVNDVLFYADAYGDGTVWGEGTNCGNGQGQGNPDLPPLSNDRIAVLLAAASDQVGEPYIMGATGPDAWDCSSFTRNAYAHLGISLPRTARAQRDWLAAGNGFRVPEGETQPGDLVFWDSYRGPNEIGHVMLVWDPAGKRTIEARRPDTGYYDYAAGPEHNIFEIWRVGNIADQPERTP